VEDIFSDRLDLCLVVFDFLPEPVSGFSDRKLLEACVAQEAIMKAYVVVLMRDVVAGAGCVSSREECTGAKALNESYASSSRTKRTVSSQQKY
jgi:hypothetical protein